jgi:hypothetical protein
MLPGPIFRREVKAAARRRDLFVARIVLAMLLGAFTLAVITARRGGPTRRPDRPRAENPASGTRGLEAGAGAAPCASSISSDPVIRAARPGYRRGAMKRSHSRQRGKERRAGGSPSRRVNRAGRSDPL